MATYSGYDYDGIHFILRSIPSIPVNERSVKFYETIVYADDTTKINDLTDKIIDVTSGLSTNTNGLLGVYDKNNNLIESFHYFSIPGKVLNIQRDYTETLNKQYFYEYFINGKIDSYFQNNLDNEIYRFLDQNYKTLISNYTAYTDISGFLHPFTTYDFNKIKSFHYTLEYKGYDVDYLQLLIDYPDWPHVNQPIVYPYNDKSLNFTDKDTRVYNFLNVLLVDPNQPPINLSTSIGKVARHGWFKNNILFFYETAVSKKNNNTNGAFCAADVGTSYNISNIITDYLKNNSYFFEPFCDISEYQDLAVSTLINSSGTYNINNNYSSTILSIPVCTYPVIDNVNSLKVNFYGINYSSVVEEELSFNNQYEFNKQYLTNVSPRDGMINLSRKNTIFNPAVLDKTNTIYINGFKQSNMFMGHLKLLKADAANNVNDYFKNIVSNYPTNDLFTVVKRTYKQNDVNAFDEISSEIISSEITGKDFKNFDMSHETVSTDTIINLYRTPAPIPSVKIDNIIADNTNGYIDMNTVIAADKTTATVNLSGYQYVPISTLTISDNISPKNTKYKIKYSSENLVNGLILTDDGILSGTVDNITSGSSLILLEIVDENNNPVSDVINGKIIINYNFIDSLIVNDIEIVGKQFVDITPIDLSTYITNKLNSLDLNYTLPDECPLTIINNQLTGIVSNSTDLNNEYTLVVTNSKYSRITKDINIKLNIEQARLTVDNTDSPIVFYELVPSVADLNNFVHLPEGLSNADIIFNISNTNELYNGITVSNNQLSSNIDFIADNFNDIDGNIIGVVEIEQYPEISAEFNINYLIKPGIIINNPLNILSEANQDISVALPVLNNYDNTDLDFLIINSEERITN